MTVKTTMTLPENYRESFTIDLQKNKKLMLLVNGVALLIGVILALIGHRIVPIGTLFSMEEGMVPYLVRFGVLIVGSILYIVLHEFVHGIFIKRYCGVKARYGFTGMYAFAGSDAYFNKHDYLIIALAPVVVWGIVLAVLQPFAMGSWFWVVYIIQISNLSGAAGDLYVTWRLYKMENILVRDYGTSMKVYLPEES